MEILQHSTTDTQLVYPVFDPSPFALSPTAELAKRNSQPRMQPSALETGILTSGTTPGRQLSRFDVGGIMVHREPLLQDLLTWSL